MKSVVVILIAALALPDAPAQAPCVIVTTQDGRRLEALSRRDEGQVLRLETIFGPLAFPARRVAKSAPDTTTVESPDFRHVTTTAWLRIVSDLQPDRHELIVDRLEGFANYMAAAYELDASRCGQRPYTVRAYRSRQDFKNAQSRLAPTISALKGQAFGEGVTGFFSPGLGEVHFWDGAVHDGGERMELAQHEVAHLFNHLFSQSGGIAIPVWFEEGTATYFSRVVALESAGTEVLREPDDHPAHLDTLGREIDAGAVYGNRELRAVPYATFHGREYGWGWGLIRHLRRGNHWPRLLTVLRKNGGAGEDFVHAFGFRSDEHFDRRWHE
ncbi:MAG: hypothetical protein KDB53_12455, partial [Planctomycetes bacterium]|nr:hypothetical protein [Planctomycetota bacterium]